MVDNARLTVAASRHRNAHRIAITMTGAVRRVRGKCRLPPRGTFVGRIAVTVDKVNNITVTMAFPEVIGFALIASAKVEFQNDGYK